MTSVDPEREVVDPATSAARLQAIVAERPDLGAAVARHPQAYDGLLDWLAVHGDAAARDAVAWRRSPVPPPPPPAPALPDVASAAATPVAPAGVQPSPYVSAIAEPGAVAGTPAEPRPRTRRGLVIGLVAGALVLVLAGGGVAWALVAGVFGGSSSPQAAVEKLLNGAIGGDPVALLTALAPSEVGALRPAVEQVGAIDAGDGGTDYLALVTQLKDAADVRLEGLEYETEEIADGIVVVRIVAGILTIDGDPERIANALVAFTEQSLVASAREWGRSDAEIQSELEGYRDRIAAGLELPFVLDVEQLNRENREYYTDSPFAAVAVDEGGWYVSPLLTYGEFAFAQWRNYDETARRGAGIVEARRFDTPDDALDGSVRAAERYLVSGRTRDVAEVLPLPERRLVSIYGGMYDVDPSYLARVTIDTARFDVEPASGQAEARIEELVIHVDGDFSITIRDICATWNREYYSSYSDSWQTDNGSGCLDRLPGLSGLGLEDARIVLVKENGGWLVSPIATIGAAATRASENLAALAREDRLEDLWR